MKDQTLGEAMAIAVLKGDKIAGYALADLLLEERERGVNAQARAAEELRSYPTAMDGYAVYRWPEFIAFCKRAGILWDLRTVRMAINIRLDEMVTIDQTYAGTDTGET